MSPVGKMWTRNVETEVQARAQPRGLSVPSCAKRRVYWAHILTAPRHDSAHELTLRAMGAIWHLETLAPSILQSDSQFQF